MACSWCGAHGHNKTTCKAAPNWIKSSRKKPQCSYCHQTGHNVRTCPSVPGDKELLHTIEANWRRELRGHLDEVLPGLGTGAIILCIETQTTLMIEKAAGVPFISDWGALTWECLRIHYQSFALPPHCGANRVWMPWVLPRHVFRDRPSNPRFTSWQVISPASESAKEYFWNDFTNYKTDLSFKRPGFDGKIMRQVMNEIDLLEHSTQITLKKTE